MMLKYEILLHCKRFSHFFSKNNSVIDHVVGTYLRVEQPVPDHVGHCMAMVVCRIPTFEPKVQSF